MSKEDKEVRESIKIMVKDIMDVDKTTLEGFNAFMNIKKKCKWCTNKWCLHIYIKN